ncbi:FAD synthase-like [Uloborus diversus]|uniref:FAD synthase-like n=1 Tax=Uloborus diversus TaxID=327109 RepID=UPI002409DDC1|nr:FAD synthase-like [Uloborus diversus]
MTSRPTVAIIIIGDEILKGQTKDTNSHFLCKEFYKLGISVLHVSVIPDDIDNIANEVSSLSEKFTFVLTSGGIGPTHDDVTYEGIGKAFNEKLILNKTLQLKLEQLCLSIGLNESAAFKMSHVPESAEVHHTMSNNRKTFIPIVSVRNVFIFPGIPSYLEHAFTQLKSLFCESAAKYFTRSLYLDTNEFHITDILNNAVKEYEGRVKFGSYPDLDSKYYQVKLVLEADTEQAIMDAIAFLRSHLPSNVVTGKYPPTSVDAMKEMFSLCDKKSHNFDKELSDSIEMSMQVLQECFKAYQIDDICLSFNGGKDCTVLLHLVFLYYAKMYPKSNHKLKVLYVRSKQPFSEIEDFIQVSVQRYNLKLITYDAPIKEALCKLKKDHLEIKAVLMGSRRTDPHCSNLNSFEMTDSDWPQFMRINPLLHWSYPLVWKFLCALEVPYCSLYDRGYTSLGCRHNTLPNALLKSVTKSGEMFYLPAYLLKEPEQEREGRTNKAT